MVLYPVILCGGGGARLWPASRPSRPKQFIPMSGNRSLFQEAVMRVLPLVREGGRLLVIGGTVHRDSILDQLAALSVEAHVLLEPEARDSGPAMAAAAAWIQRQDPDGVAVFVASDHHVPDHDAFRLAVTRAASAAAQEGRIVTLGVRPTEPSAAYGYIRPSGGALSPVEVFTEKPDRGLAAKYIAAGYLWNSGNFIVSAKVLLAELSSHAPGVAMSARAALPVEDEGSVQILSAEFGSAPKISIDYAVMEKTRLASVLAVDFAWSDMGAWDAIAASGEGNVGTHIFEDADGCLVRAADGVLVAALGVRNLAIVAERDAILICDLSRAQDVKRVVERIRLTSPQHLDFSARPLEPIADGARRFADWLRLRALPVWSTLGLRDGAGFSETLALDGRALDVPSRARVQARQVYVYAQAGLLGWNGPWRRAVTVGLETLFARYLRDDGTSRSLVSQAGDVLDETARLYDHAFILLALATAARAGVQAPELEARAVRLRDGLMAQALPNGALLEAGDHPYQANAHMHLLEACLAWEAAGGDAGWGALADRIVGLALDVFIDADGGFVREYFDASWTPAPGLDGRLIEPGHQFEWAWLLTRHGRARDDRRALETARRLYSAGRAGVAERGGVAQDAMNDDGSLRSGRARLWPQTEWLKAALLLAEDARDGDRLALIADAQTALAAIWLYLTPEGLWRDKRLPQGTFVEEAAPASSFYHVMAAFQQLNATGGTRGFEGLAKLDLD